MKCGPEHRPGRSAAYTATSTEKVKSLQIGTGIYKRVYVGLQCLAPRKAVVGIIDAVLCGFGYYLAGDPFSHLQLRLDALKANASHKNPSECPDTTP